MAIDAAMRDREGMWFGWCGKVAEAPGELQVIGSDALTYVLTEVHPRDFHEYYHGFANRVLWPVLHYRVDLAAFSQNDLDGYCRVNEFFAERLGTLLRPDDIVWVHDYHLILLALALRRRGHRNRIGFFLHTPLPPPDLLTALPGHESLFGEALAEFDLIGFQTDNDALNYARYLTSIVGAATRDGRDYRLGDRQFRIGVFPVGVDPGGVQRLAVEAWESPFAQDYRASLSGKIAMISIDRLDYSKGIINHCDGYERFLEKYPVWHGKAMFLQIAPQSRSEIPEYAEIDAAVSARVGHVNGRFGTVDWVPLRYVNRNHRRPEIAALLRMGRVGVVTPLRDGMNLVAKEFVAAQDPDDPGVLVLSRFAGAARELTAALLVNPYDRDCMADAMNRALIMPLDERQARHAEMLAVLEANHIRFWGQSFIEALTRPGPTLNWLTERIAVR